MSSKPLLRKGVFLAAALAAGFGAAAVVYKGALAPKPQAAPEAPAQATAVGATSLLLNPHEQPRVLKSFKFIDGDLKAVSLDDFRGKFVLLNIWATWCGPCRTEMPTLERLQKVLGGPDFEVVALSIDNEGVPVVKQFYKELGIEALRVFVDPTMKAPLELNVIGVPTTLLLDREGREIARYAGPAEWDSPGVVAVIRTYLERAPVAQESAEGSRKEK